MIRKGDFGGIRKWRGDGSEIQYTPFLNAIKTQKIGRIKCAGL